MPSPEHAPTIASARRHRYSARLQRRARSDRAQSARGTRRQARLHRRSGRYTYGELAERVNRCANALSRLGAAAPRSACCCACSTRIDFPAVFLGAIKAGIVPVAGNTLLTTADYEYMLARQPRAGARSCRRRCCRRSQPLLARRRSSRARRSSPGADAAAPHSSLAQSLVARASADRAPAPTRRATTPASGSTRRARPARPRARCTCTSSLIADRRALRASRCSASARTTSCSRRPSCSSPTASATR